MTRYQFLLKLAFLGGAVVMIVVTGVLIGCGHDGAITNTFLGLGAAFSAANVWQMIGGNNKDQTSDQGGGSG